MSKGYVYILTNPSMPGLVKIGKTTRDPEGRANELDTTGVPTPFVVFHFEFAPDCHELEAVLHQRLEQARVRAGREFFKVDALDAEQALRDAQREQVEEWLEEFIPDQNIVDINYHLDLGSFHKSVYEVFRQHDISPPDAVRVLECLRGDDLSGAVARWKVVREQVKKALEDRRNADARE